MRRLSRLDSTHTDMGLLTVNVIEGKDLLGMDRGGKSSDPYAVFELNGEKVFKTKTEKKTLVRPGSGEKLTCAASEME